MTPLKKDYPRKSPESFAIECDRIEQRFVAIQESAARLDSEDPALADLHREGLGLIDRLTEIATEIRTQVRRMWAFYEANKGGAGTGILAALLAPGSRDAYRAKFEMEEIDYNSLLSLIEDTKSDWLDWLSRIRESPATADGMVSCPQGHANHPSRSNCLVCGRSLA